MKAIVLTYSPVKDSDKVLLQNTKIFKVAINQHGEEYNPDVRVAGDWNLGYLCRNFKQPIVSLRDHFRYISPREIRHNIEFKGATIVGAIEWLIDIGYDNILLVADNTVNSEDFKDIVLYHTTRLRYWSGAQIYQYRNGNFMLPVKSIKDFIGEGK